MSNASPEELKESIEELTIYKDRLEEQVINISRKLRIPSKKINSIIEEHQELKQIKEIISKLEAQSLFEYSENKS